MKGGDSNGYKNKENAQENISLGRAMDIRPHGSVAEILKSFGRGNAPDTITRLRFQI